MKTKITALALITVTALSLAPKTAVASDRGLAIVGGFLGGLIVASAINDSRHESYSDRPTAIIVDEQCDHRNNEGYYYRNDEGYWREVAVQVWVPGCWIVERDYYGRACRRYSEAHYERRNNRVWVTHDREHRSRDGHRH